MAMLEWLDGDRRLSKSFASLPEVRAALDRVFRPEPTAGGSVINAALRHDRPGPSRRPLTRSLGPPTIDRRR